MQFTKLQLNAIEHWYKQQQRATSKNKPFPYIVKNQMAWHMSYCIWHRLECIKIVLQCRVVAFNQGIFTFYSFFSIYFPFIFCYVLFCYVYSVFRSVYAVQCAVHAYIFGFRLQNINQDHCSKTFFLNTISIFHAVPIQWPNNNFKKAFHFSSFHFK